jgi:hypothetical protein
MKIIYRTVPILAALFVVAISFSVAQSAPADNMAILLEKIRADKKLVVAVNMQLSKSEAKAFWPIYGRYQKGLTKHLIRLKSLVEKYAQSYKTMTDKVAKELVDEWFDVQAGQLKLQRSYLPEFRKALPDVKVMRYYQLESKIDTVLRYELASIIPLVQK